MSLNVQNTLVHKDFSVKSHYAFIDFILFCRTFKYYTDEVFQALIESLSRCNNLNIMTYEMYVLEMKSTSLHAKLTISLE